MALLQRRYQELARAPRKQTTKKSGSRKLPLPFRPRHQSTSVIPADIILLEGPVALQTTAALGFNCLIQALPTSHRASTNQSTTTTNHHCQRAPFFRSPARIVFPDYHARLNLAFAHPLRPRSLCNVRQHHARYAQSWGRSWPHSHLQPQPSTRGWSWPRRRLWLWHPQACSWW